MVSDASALPCSLKIRGGCAVDVGEQCCCTQPQQVPQLGLLGGQEVTVLSSAEVRVQGQGCGSASGHSPTSCPEGQSSSVLAWCPGFHA